MKQPIKDVLQVIVALLITSSTAYAMQAPVKPIQHSHANTTVKTAIKVKTVHVTTLPQKPVKSTVIASQPVITWQDNPQHCTSDQYIAAVTPFNCIDKPVVASSPSNSSTPDELMTSAGIASSDWPAVDYIVSHESSWNADATEPTTLAHGLVQALPYSKTNCGWDDGVCQLEWGQRYAIARYGGWWGAYDYWVANHNW